MVRVSFLIAHLVLMLFVQVPSAKDWRGLSPLKSTRTDVEKLLGQPDGDIDPRLMTYYLPDVVVTISLSGNPKCRLTLPYNTWDVTAETVTGIRVSLKRPVVLDEGIDLTKLKKIMGDSDVADHFYYSDGEGFSIEVGNKYVMGYVYEPSSKSRNLLCAAK